MTIEPMIITRNLACLINRSTSSSVRLPPCTPFILRAVRYFSRATSDGNVSSLTISYRHAPSIPSSAPTAPAITYGEYFPRVPDNFVAAAKVLAERAPFCIPSNARTSIVEKVALTPPMTGRLIACQLPRLDAVDRRRTESTAAVAASPASLTRDTR